MEKENEDKIENEPVKSFNVISDKVNLIVTDESRKTELVNISGYDLQINFNFEYIKTLEDVEEAASGISKMFKEIILSKMIDKKQ